MEGGAQTDDVITVGVIWKARKGVVSLVSELSRFRAYE